jgi:hypothetical protein
MRRFKLFDLTVALGVVTNLTGDDAARVHQLCRTAFGADAVLVLSDAAALPPTTTRVPAPRPTGRHGNVAAQFLGGSQDISCNFAETEAADAGLKAEKEENGIVVAGAFASWWRHTTGKAGTSVTATAAIKAAWRSALQALPPTLDPCPFALDRVVLPSVRPPAETMSMPGLLCEPVPAAIATSVVPSAGVSWTGVDVNAAFAAAQRRGARRAAMGGPAAGVAALAAPDDAAWGAFD